MIRWVLVSFCLAKPNVFIDFQQQGLMGELPVWIEKVSPFYKSTVSVIEVAYD